MLTLGAKITTKGTDDEKYIRIQLDANAHNHHFCLLAYALRLFEFRYRFNVHPIWRWLFRRIRYHYFRFYLREDLVRIAYRVI
mgnify:CR=1 FL=1